MKKTSLAISIIFLSACATHKPVSSSERVKENVSDKKILILEDVLTQKSKDPADVIKWMKKCSEECQPPDQGIAKDLYEGYGILFSTAAKTPKMSQLNAEQKIQVSIGQEKIRKAFLRILEVKEGRDILETAYRELANPESLYASVDTEVQTAISSAIERLKKNPKTLATGWYLKAISTPQNSDNVLEMMESYKNCVNADREDLICRSSYEELVRFYERPRCQEPHFSSGVSFVSGNGSDQKVILGSSDLLESTLESIGPDHWEIWFTLKTFSAKKLEDFTAEKDQKKLLVMTFDGKELSQAAVNQKITDGSFRMIFQNVGLAKEAFEKLCKAPNPEKIPENLSLTPASSRD